MTATAPATGARRRRWPALTGVLVVAVAVAVVMYRPGASRDEAVEPPTIPASVFSFAGTALPDGLRVPEGARLVGTPMTHDDPLHEYDGVPVPARSWRAVLLVDGEVSETWTATRRVVAEALGIPVDVSDGAGCWTEDHSGFQCRVGGVLAAGDGGQLVMSAELETVPGDVTGQYSIVMSTVRQPFPHDGPPALDPDVNPAGVPAAPPPPQARARPGVGEPLATTLAEETAPADFVLVEGSQLLVQYAVNSNAGFGVLLRVLPEASVDAVAAEYAATPRLGGEPITQRTTVNDGQTVTSYRPIGEAGGYGGVVFAVDNTTGDDYIYYDVGYD
jgi:hypothetical protein